MTERERGQVEALRQENGAACLLRTPDPLPEEMVPAMAWVPYQQWSDEIFGAGEALEAGTLFPVLDKPFSGRGAADHD